MRMMKNKKNESRKEYDKACNIVLDRPVENGDGEFL